MMEAMNKDVDENQTWTSINEEVGNFTNDSAMMIAYERALETSKGAEIALFQDPLAKLLQGSKGETLSKIFGEYATAFGFTGWPDFHKTWTAVRTKFIDDRIQEYIDKGGETLAQMVNLGAGFDTRAYRLECYKKITKVFDVDMKVINEAKEKAFDLIMKNYQMNKHYRGKIEMISLDFLDQEKNLSSELSNAGFSKNKPTIFVAEGLIMYLGTGKTRFLKDVSNTAPPGSILILNFMAFLNEEEGREKDPTYMSTTDLVQLLVAEGWDNNSITINQFGDSALNYGRYPNDKFEESPSFSFLVCKKL
jgi:methyltransferase (TIGR00027 family)